MKVMVADPDQTVLAGLLGSRGFTVAYVAKIAGLSWTAVDNFVHGRTPKPDAGTVRKVTQTVSLLLRRDFTEEQVVQMTQTKVTKDSRSIERGLRGDWNDDDDQDGEHSTGKAS